jgi:hypothetical protein
MKKTILFLVIAVALTTQTLLAQVPSYVPSNGLVGYWPFNGNANDQTPNGNNGTVNGATLTSDRFGNANSAYSFDGVNDYIQINNIVSNFGLSDFTISIWYNTQSLNSSHLINKRYNESCGNFWEFRKEGFEISQDIGCTENISILNTQNIQINNWCNVIIKRNGNILKYYIDGILSQTITTSIIHNINNDNNVIIGAVIAPISGFLQAHNGKIDDIGMLTRALTQEEITAMYNGVNYSDTCNNVSGSLTQGLVGYWPFCGNANDDSGNGNNGTVNGATLSTDRFGNANSAYNFSGGSSVNVPMTLLLHNLPVRTFSCWFNANGAQNGGRIYETTYLNGGIGMYNGNVLDAWYSNGTYECNVTNINAGNLNEWHNLVYVTDSNTGLGSVYLDGVFIASRNGLPSTSPSNWLNNFLRFGLGAQGESFIGKIDDIGIWNRALTPSEITQLYNQNQCFTNTTVTDTLVINVGQLSYTNPVTYANNITIAPNPASTEININFNNITNLNGGTLKIINSLGQEVATTPITTSGTNSTMQLTTWGGTGMYFVQIINPQGQIVDIKKIILQ